MTDHYIGGMCSPAFKPEWPPLLPEGLHVLSLEELYALCVTRFPFSGTRNAVGNGLGRFIDLLQNQNIPCELWLDGSFLTEKMDPGDVDLVVHVNIETTRNASPEQENLLVSIENGDFYLTDHCDSYIMASDPGVDLYIDTYNYWREWFGLSRASYEKGMAILQVNGGLQ